MNIKEISSPQNPLIRHVSRLRSKSRTRREEGVCVIEGLREVERAARSGVVIETIFYRPDLTPHAAIEALLADAPPRPSSVRDMLYVHCSEAVFKRISYRADVPNVIVIAHRIDHEQLSGSLGAHPFLLLLEGIEKPGNLGAILRTADALGVTGVILIDCLVELDHPHTIRNSLGAVFSLNIAKMNSTSVIQLLETYHIPLYVTHLHTEARALHTLPLNASCAVLLGAEATGVNVEWIEDFGGRPIVIPMISERVVDSLNVSVAASIVMYEVARQRGGVS